MTSTDRQIYKEVIDGIVPGKVFDMHVHVHPKCDCPKVSLSLVKAFEKMLLPGRECARLLLPYPFHGSTVEQVNRLAFSELAKEGGAGGASLIFTEPSMSASQVREQVLTNNAVGLKVYMSHATVKDKSEAPICSFLPEKHIKVMDELGLMVMLHLSKRRAIADPDNIRDIELLSKKYPKSKWVLAHCGRCFRPNLFERAADRLNKLPNVYVDTAAVCDPLVFMEVYKNFDTSRVLFGTDNVAAGGVRGRYVEAGLFWVLLGRGGPDWGDAITGVQPTFVVYEQLRAMARAAELVKLSKTEIRNIFWNNAVKLLKEIRAAR
jgi:glutamate-1-semialdehyde 2,1-aminomutase